MIGILATPLLGADFRHMEQEMWTVEKAGAQYIHLDMVDGTLISSISFDIPMIASLRSYTERASDAHMMVKKPERYIDDIRACGADIICVHAEACIHLDSVISRIKASGARVGMALNPATPTYVLGQILSQVDMVLIITVNSGFGGQFSIPYTPRKAWVPRIWCDSLGFTMDIEVDGGIPAIGVRPVLEAGANVIVVGSTVSKGDTYESARELMELLREHER